jgi:hypothetical protein
LSSPGITLGWFDLIEQCQSSICQSQTVADLSSDDVGLLVTGQESVSYAIITPCKPLLLFRVMLSLS